MFTMLPEVCLDQSEASIMRSDQWEAGLIWVTCVMSQSEKATHADNTRWQKYVRRKKIYEKNKKIIKENMEKQNHNNHNNNTNKAASLDAGDGDLGM